jgi:type II secretory ATPase GspE/PulE/Tfp pilus assembly ATPase PilB-like protein
MQQTAPNLAGSNISGDNPNNLGTSDFSDKKTVGDILIEERILKPEQVNQLKIEAAKRGVDVGKLILEAQIVPEDRYYEALSKLYNVPYASVSTLPFSPEALGSIPRAVAERFRLIPFAVDDNTKTLSVVMANPLDLEAINFISQKSGMQIRVFQGVPSEILNAIQTQYSFGLVGEVKAALKESEQIQKVKTFDKDTISSVIKEAPIAKIVSTILEYAVKSRASDVHIEPQEDRMRVRYRIDGILYERLSLPIGVREAVISRIKILSGMKIDEHRTPQDGRFNFKVGQEEVDLRVSVLPTAFGEKIVMRLLKKSGGVPTLQELGLRGTSLRALEAAILRPHGIILVCGPTGSGKTTTLYSVLTKLNTTRVNILTLEDPIEYQIAGTNQVQINPDVGLTFASGLRSFLRQDPNIILVGEIRDQETTELAIQAALTGHLVFSTLHTSNAAGALPRLIDMGAETFLLASTITASLGQRIARKICDTCKTSYNPPLEIISEIRKSLGDLMSNTPDNQVKLFKGTGCDKCGHSGFLGRIGIFEVMPVSENIAKLILRRADSATLEKQSVAEGMITIKQDGYLKVLDGLTTIDEVLRVAQE